MAKLGRPRALDDVKRREFCALISAGYSLTRAADYVGCNPATIRREALRNADFHDRLRQAEMCAELEPLRALRDKFHTDWRAAAWLLERIDPDRFLKNNVRTNETINTMQEFVEEIAHMLVNEIEDEAVLQRIVLRLTEIAKSTAQDKFALSRPRRDPHRAKRMLARRENDENETSGNDAQVFENDDLET